MSLSLVSGNSLGYYYGYSNATFGVQQSSDPFANQNINYSPQVSMGSSQSQNQTYDYGSSYATSVAATTYTGGFGVLATTYGYSIPATAQAPTYTTQSTSYSTSDTWGAVSSNVTSSTVTFSSWNPAAGVSGMVVPTSSSTQSVSSGSSGSFYTPFGSWNTFVTSTAPAPSVYDIVYSDYSSTSFSSNGWAAVNMSAIPRVTSTITTTPAVPTPTTPVTVNLGNGATPLSAPEPGTILTMSAGLALLLLKFRRRSS